MISTHPLIPPDTREASYHCGAVLSEDRHYRYVLWRRFDLLLVDRRPIAFLGLNPSTADERDDDPTIRRCIGFARRWGFGQLVMLNLYAWRSREPEALWDGTVQDPVGPQNDELLERWGVECGTVIACWGSFSKARERGRHVLNLLHELGVDVQVLDFTAVGAPRHPLYARADLQPRSWDG